MNILIPLEMASRTGFGENLSQSHRSSISPFDSVSRLVTDRPARALVFEKWNLGYCCGKGQFSLLVACATGGVDYRAVLHDLEANDETPCLASGCGLDSKTLGQLSATELINHIVDVHHTFLRRELPRLSNLMDCVASKHGAHFPELWELQGALEQFKEHVEAHLDYEERELFPLVKQAICVSQSQILEAQSHASGRRGGALAEDLSCTHAAIREQLRLMRRLTRGFVPPDGACCIYRVLLDGLAAMETDLRRHFAEEENLLLAHSDIKPMTSPGQ